MAAARTARPARGRRGRVAARRGLAAVAGVVLVLLATACGAPRVDPPEPTVPRHAPAVVEPPTDPADDPQLDALDLPDGVPGVSEPSGDDDVARLERLPALADQLRGRLGDDVEVCKVATDYGLAATVLGDGRVSEWRIGLDLGDDRLIQAAAPPSAACDEPFTLAGVDFAVPARLVRGIQRRLPGVAVTDVTLATEAGWGLVWDVRVYRGGHSQAVVALPSGSVLAVTP